MKKFLYLIPTVIILWFVSTTFVSADDCYPCDSDCQDYWSSGGRTFIPCSSPGCSDGDDGGGDDSPPPCVPSDCTLPVCPSDTTNTDTSYPASTVSCSKGCGQSKSGTCYEIPPVVPPVCNPLIQVCEEIPENPEDPEDPENLESSSWTSAEVKFKPSSSTNRNNLGFVSNLASGLTINNPVTVEAKYYSTVDVNNLEAIYFWMSKEGTSPTEIQWLGEERSNGKVKENFNFGFMIRKVDGQWKDIYIPYSGDKMYWVKVKEIGTSFTIDGPSGNPMVLISDLEITQTNNVVSNFSVEFLNSTSDVSPYEQVHQGKYDVYAMANDIFGFTPYDNYTNPDALDLLPYELNQIRTFNNWFKADKWIVDLTPPSLEQNIITIKGPTEICVLWDSGDNETSIAYTVGNAFRLKEDLIKNVDITYPYPDGNKIKLNFQTAEDILGKIDGTNILWRIANTSSREEKIGLDLNRGGYIDFYVTVFDVAGNHSNRQSRFKLGEWIQTRGGFFYSEGGTGIDVRELSGNLWQLQDLFNYGFTLDSADLSTELLSGFVSSALNLRVLLNKNSSYRVTSINNPFSKDIYYSYLKKLKDASQEKIAAISSNTLELSGKLSNYCSQDSCAGKIYVGNIDGDLSVNSGFLCDAKGVFLVNGTVTIDPDLKEKNKSDACVFISKGDITISKGSDHTTSTSIGFDVVEAYLVSNGVINIQNENKLLNERKDALILKGGIVGFGQDPETEVSINVKRELHLQDRHPYPVLNVVHHVKYGKLIAELFGGEKLVFKSEIGLKPF
ncbi:MAG: hypothetical protein AB9915_03545 [Candidatus Dojkabacteria bacterium]